MEEVKNPKSELRRWWTKQTLKSFRAYVRLGKASTGIIWANTSSYTCIHRANKQRVKTCTFLYKKKKFILYVCVGWHPWDPDWNRSYKDRGAALGKLNMMRRNLEMLQHQERTHPLRIFRLDRLKFLLSVLWSFKSTALLSNLEPCQSATLQTVTLPRAGS